MAPANAASQNETTSDKEQAIWDAYNLLLGGSDKERLRKLLARYEMFRWTIDLPGDIVECGVFKGTGLLCWLKFLEIHSPGSSKRAIGFDVFQGFEETADPKERSTVRALLNEASFEGTTPDRIRAMVNEASIPASRCELIQGDITQTALDYANKNPGFRISLLHLDLDLARPTLAALEAFWPRVVRGGVVIFDEYAIPKWTESEAVDTWLKTQTVRLQTLPWSRTPTAYVIKP